MKTRMSKLIRRNCALVALCTVFFTSCMMEEAITYNNEAAEGVMPVKFQAGIGAETRVSNPEGNKWDKTDTIGVYMIKAGSVLADSVIREGAKNKPYVVASGEGTNTATFATASDTIFYPNGEDVNFIAYYPYSARSEVVSADNKYNMNVSDQSVQPRLDLLYSNNKTAYNSKNHDVLLPFGHLMTRLVFDILPIAGSKISLSGLQMSVQNVNTATVFDLSTGLPASDGAGQSTITPVSLHEAADSIRKEATLIPVADASNIRLFFTLNNKAYTASLPETASGKALQKGKRYMYKVLFDEAEVIVGGELSPWDESPGGDISPTPDLSNSIYVNGYRGQATVAYTSGKTETLTISESGHAKLGDAYLGDAIRSLTLDNATTPTAIMIGRKVADANPLSLHVDATGKPILRDAIDGYIPIGSYAEFQLLNESANISANKKYRQEADLDLMNEEWKPIGNKTSNFVGEYDGGEHEIANLKISGNAFYVGLFGGTSNATLNNIRLVSGSVSGERYVGAVCGQALNTTSVTNTHSAVTIMGGTYIGGICGIVTEAIFSFCRNTGNVTSDSSTSFAGGIVGRTSSGTTPIINCDNSGNIEGGEFIGGIVGLSVASDNITACRNSGNIKGTYAGGIMGYHDTNFPCTITACYNTGSVNNTKAFGVGGIIGEIAGEIASSVVNACYSTGTVTGSDSNTTGLICGVNSKGTITSCFWTKGSSTVDKGVGKGEGDTKAFSGSAWPTANEAGWGIGDGSGDNKYWKDLGGWNDGAPVYPKLWWE
jgi:hypothetical protein